MSAVEADFCGAASRIPAVKAEVLYEYDSKHRAVYLGVSSHKENGVSSTPTRPAQLSGILLGYYSPATPAAALLLLYLWDRIG